VGVFDDLANLGASQPGWQAQSQVAAPGFFCDFVNRKVIHLILEN
jgi:hypothetical protein